MMIPRSGGGLIPARFVYTATHIIAIPDENRGEAIPIDS